MPFSINLIQKPNKHNNTNTNKNKTILTDKTKNNKN